MHKIEDVACAGRDCSELSISPLLTRGLLHVRRRLPQPSAFVSSRLCVNICAEPLQWMFTQRREERSRNQPLTTFLSKQQLRPSRLAP